MPKMFTVPQFIDTESKVIGSLTIRQFLISIFGVILIGICYKLFSFVVFVVVGIIIFLITLLFAFVKINGRPFHFFVLNFLQTTKRPSLRIWDHKNFLKMAEDVKMEQVKEQEKMIKKESIDSSRLSKLSLIVDTQGIYKGDDLKKKNEQKEQKKSKEE